ncbi:MAG: hypothetical protein BMS9Abin34_134 [Patescibacteria group bacterium]|nr:MAG: hypothetical protein BMS9Abin34_134 [Patescibacteria group bacterium]
MRKILPKKRIKRDAPPKIIYLIGILAYAVWVGWGYVLLKVSPNTLPHRLLFLGALFSALFLTFLFLFYQAGKIITGRAPSVVFYPAVRRALFTGGWVAAAGTMQLLGIFNWVNVGLLGLILLLTEVQISRGQR